MQEEINALDRMASRRRATGWQTRDQHWRGEGHCYGDHMYEAWLELSGEREWAKHAAFNLVKLKTDRRFYAGCLVHLRLAELAAARVLKMWEPYLFESSEII